MGQKSDAHYKSIYFHADSPEIRSKQEAYVGAMAEATRRLMQEREVFPILVGMEQLDRSACEMLATELGTDVPVFVSDEHEMYEMVSVIRHASMMVSSRYHAIVTSMPGLVPSAGITMDERIRNLMRDRGQPELALEVDDPHLADRTYEVLLRLMNDGDQIRLGIGRCVVENLRRMGTMGMSLVDHVREHHPEFPFRENLGGQGDPWAHLPELPHAVHRLVDEHGRNP
jgi:polysaccharide pyruvyl transferase WcaK-like protein